MTKILLALDDTDESQAAAVGAQRLFGDGAEYLAIYVADRPTDTSAMTWGSVYGYTFAPTPAVVDRMAVSATDVVTDARSAAAQHAHEAGVDAAALGAVGDAADAIARAATDHGVDAIVVGHHQRGWFRSLFDPSVSEDVLDHAHVPVVVVPS